MAPRANAASGAGGRRADREQTARHDEPGGRHHGADTPHALTGAPTRVADRVELAPAKINLFLHVTGHRADGYHLLDSLAVFAAAGDMLHAEIPPGLPASISLNLDGPFGAALADEPDNLVLRTARALEQAALVPLGARLTLTKHLPLASGIGGGSADAAAALRLLCRLWSVPPDRVDLPRLAAALGADVPVCLASRPARMRGVGDQLLRAPLIPPCGVALLNPGVRVVTGEVFRSRSGDYSSVAGLPTAWPHAAAMAADLAALRNDLQQPAIRVCPPIAQVLEALGAQSGCLLARMSGSGATCFGLFADPAAAKTAAHRLRRPGWWGWGGALLE